jgi:HD-like signal output (HDOD) protein
MRTIALSYTMQAAVPKPKGGLFDQEAFWTDSLCRALLARSLAKRFMPGEEDKAFTAMLLSDVALPVLLCIWRDYYAPIVERWRTGAERLSRIERADFRWDHAQAGAWILNSWEFPEEIVCLAGAHNLPLSEIRELGLEKSVALVLACASLLPSVLRPDKKRARQFVKTGCKVFSLTEEAFGELIWKLQVNFHDIREQFALRSENSDIVLDELLALCDFQPTEAAS